MHNTNLNQLVEYVDTELREALSDEQRDNIIGLATAALSTDERIASRSETGEKMVDAARRITPIPEPEPKKPNELWRGIKIFVATIGVITMVSITVYFYSLS